MSMSAPQKSQERSHEVTHGEGRCYKGTTRSLVATLPYKRSGPLVGMASFDIGIFFENTLFVLQLN